MRWHKSNIEPAPEKFNSHFIIKLLENPNEFRFVKWYSSVHHFYDDNNTHYTMSEIDEWCYVNEDDCVMDEMLALSAIQDAVNHVQALYDILLTDEAKIGRASCRERV